MSVFVILIGFIAGVLAKLITPRNNEPSVSSSQQSSAS
jgi:uncharacterized membrane protein YeaQ/YmgE (transglycosylase-associated protein family)